MSILDSLTLNPAQKEAVTYLDGHLLVVAGAGSGKTRVLGAKIAYLMEQGVPPYEIMALTFTNKAADEMRQRVAKLIGAEYDGGTRGLTMGTFHSVFLRILIREIEHTPYRPGFSIYDATDSRSLVKLIVKEMGLDEKKYKPAVVAGRISDAKNRRILPNDYASNSSMLHKDEVQNMEQVHRIYTAYQQHLMVNNAMDFDDLLLQTYLLLRDHQDVREYYQTRYPNILVDEYQDTNQVQNDIVKLLCGERSRICAVGDDAQSIYGFRGAEIGNILNFERDFPCAKVIKLEENYRSTQTIVAAAGSVISHNRGQIHKEVFSRGDVGQLIPILPAMNNREEGTIIANEIKRLANRNHVPYNEIAVLYRTNSQSRSLEEALRERFIPYRIFGGLSFYQRKEIKDVLAYIRVVCNPDDTEALRRILNYPARGIGKTTEDKLQHAAIEHNLPLWQILSNPTQYGVELQRGALGRLAAFCLMVNQWRDKVRNVQADQLIITIIRESGIGAQYQGNDVESKSARDNLEELVGSVRSAEVTDIEDADGDFITLPEFLRHVSLITDREDYVREDEPAVSLMTIHAAKGLEFDAVFVTGMEEELFPSASAKHNPREMEEERRLFYVAITRARRNLFLTYAKERFRYGEHCDCLPSPFLEEIDRRFLTGAVPQSGRRAVSGYTQDRRFDSNPAYHNNIVSSSPTSRKIPLAHIVDRPAQGRSASVHFAPGDRVMHDRFGAGTVESLDGTGMNERARIAFDNAGEKTLLLRFAKLTKSE